MTEDFRILGIDTRSSWKDVKQGYIDQVKVWHPDRFTHDERLRLKAEEMTKTIHTALQHFEDMKAEIIQTGNKLDLSAPFLAQYLAYVEKDIPISDGCNLDAWSKDANSMWKGDGAGPSIHKQAANSYHKVSRERRPTVQMTIRRRKKHVFPFVSCSVAAATVALLLSTGFMSFDWLEGNQYFPKPVYQVALAQELEPSSSYRLLTPEKKNSAILPTAVALERIPRPKSSSKPQLIDAAASCNVSKAQSLLRTGADINESDSHGRTALIWAAKRNCPKVVKLLIGSGANTSIPSNNGFTAYRWAKWYRNDAVVAVLEGTSRLRVSSSRRS
jgi:hypothetical protein